MQIVIDVPNEEVPKHQDTIDVHISFIDGTISQCNYPFEVLPEGHGRLIDADALIFNADYYEPLISKRDFDFAPTIIEADKAESEVEE